MGTLRVVELAGTPADRGYQHGQALAQEIVDLYDLLIAEAAAQSPPIEERDLLAYAMGHLPESRAYAPDLVEEVDAIAKGAGLPFEKVWLLNCFDEVEAYGLYRGVNAGHKCTTFAATGLSTNGGTTYLGQTWDAVDGWQPIIFDIAPGDDQPGALVFSNPGIVAGNGINAAGIALVWNTLRSLDARSGVPCTFLVRKALQQTKLSDAVHTVVKGVRAAGFNFVIGTTFAAVNVEASATQYRIRYISRHYGHANHYEEPDLLQYEGSPASVPPATSPIRSGRMRQLLDEASGLIELEKCKEMLRDHANYPASICRHKDPPRSEFYTTSALLYQPDQGLMLATDRQACDNPFQEFRIAASP